MFNTGVNHFLQQFDYPWLKFFMELISSIGNLWFILIVVFGIAFGLHFKRGIVLMNIIAWTVLFSAFTKKQVDFPRPIDVDITLQSEDYNKYDNDLVDKQPTEFMAVFSDELLSVTRNDSEQNYGFPSGHTAVQVALWFGMFFIFRKRWIVLLGSTMIVLTVMSRVYLAHHFLGDTLGGIFLGIAVLLLLILLVQKSRFLKAPIADFKTLSLLWLPVLAIPFAEHLSITILGSLLGVNMATFFIILQGNTLLFNTNSFKRILTAGIMISFVFLASFLIKKFDFNSNIFIQLAFVTAVNFIVLRGGVLLLKKINLIRYKL